MVHRMLLLSRLSLCGLLLANCALPAFAYQRKNQAVTRPPVTMKGLPHVPNAASQPGKEAVFGVAGTIPIPTQDTHLSEVGQRVYAVPATTAQAWKSSSNEFDQLHFAE